MAGAVRGMATVVSAREDVGHDASGADSYWWQDAASLAFGKGHWFLELDVSVAGAAPYRVTGRYPMPNRLFKVRKLLDGPPRLKPGVLLPVVVDGRDHRKLDIDWKAFKDSGGLDQLYPYEPGIATMLKETFTAEPADAGPRMPSRPRPTRESHPPVEGVDYDAWIAATVAIVRNRIPRKQQTAYYEACGFPGGRVEAINAIWWERVKADDAARDWYVYDNAHLDLGQGPPSGSSP